VEVDGESTSHDRARAKRLQGLDAAADTGKVRPRLLALVLAVLLAACGGGEDRKATAAGDRQVGTADVERLLVNTQKRRSPGLRVGTASWPRPGPAGQRDQVRLHRPDRGHPGPLRGHLRDVDAAKATGRFALAPAKPIIDVARVVQLIRSELQPTARTATVRCGAPRVRVVEIGAAIACTITLGDAVQRVRAVVKDLEGTVVVRG
jgi:hypothetical protein